MSEPRPSLDPIAIVLAGGASSRFGGDKLAADLDGEPVLHHAVRAVGSVAHEIVLVLSPDGPVPRVPAELAGRIIVARDVEAFGGPLAGVGAALDALPVPDHPPRIALIVGGDMPGLVPGVLQLLAGTLAASPGVVIVTLEVSPPAPLPFALRVPAGRAEITRCLASGRRSLRSLFDTLPSAVVPAAAWLALDPDGRTLVDVDWPGDLPGR